MAISGFIPTTALPATTPGATSLAGSTPLAGAAPGSLYGGSMLPAAEGAVERPGIRHRLASAMRAAIGELRGGSSRMAVHGNRQTLPLHAQGAVGAHGRPDAASDRPRTARRVKSARSWKTLANPPRGAAAAVAGASAAAGAAGAAGLASQQQPSLPANATQLPGATVYSYDGNGAPVAPTMQQLGVNPAMIHGLAGLADGVAPSGPQLNATNQTNLSGLGAGIGAGFGLVGPAGIGAPVLGQPINLAAPAAAADPRLAPVASPASGATQAVTNRNTTDVDSQQQGLGGYGYGGIGSPWDPSGGIATPYSPYGASMTGASMLGGERRGFLSRLFG